MRYDYKDPIIITEKETKMDKFIEYLFCTAFAGVGLMTLWVLLVIFMGVF